MDDFEKDEFDNENDNVEPTDDAIPKDEKLNEELENLKETFQSELDKATAQAEAEDIEDAKEKDEDEEEPVEISESDLPIQELDEITQQEDDEHTDAEAPEVNLCECCGENPVSENFGEDYPYCDNCRELMKKYPLRASGIIMAVVMVIFVGLTFYFSMDYVDDYSVLLDAGIAYDSGKLTTAMTDYSTYISSLSMNEKPSRKVINKLIDGYTVMGYYGDAADIIKDNFDENALSKPWNAKYQKVLDDYTSLTTTYYKITEIMGDVLNGSTDYDYDKVMAELDSLIGKTADDETTTESDEATTESAEKTQPVVYNEVFVEYYKYVLMSLHNEPLEEQMVQLQKVDSMDDDLEWIYLTNIIGVAAKLGNTELAEKYFNRCISVNKEDSSPYIAYANAFRFTETPDADKMIEICNEAAANVGSDTTYLNTLAIAYLLKEDGKNAMATMEQVMSTGSYTVQGCNLYALTSLYVGEDDNYGEMKTLLENYNFEISKLVTQYKNGKISLAEVLTDNGGDI